MYYLRIETRNQFACKIGITNRSLEERYTDLIDKEKITILFDEYYEEGVYAYHHEQETLKKFEQSRYKAEPILSNGNSELFDHDALELDKSYQ